MYEKRKASYARREKHASAQSTSFRGGERSHVNTENKSQVSEAAYGYGHVTGSKKDRVARGLVEMERRRKHGIEEIFHEGAKKCTISMPPLLPASKAPPVAQNEDFISHNNG